MTSATSMARRRRGTQERRRSMAQSKVACCSSCRWSFPPLQHIPDRLGFLLVGKGRRTLDIVPLTPHIFLLYVCCATGAHQPSTGWAPPIRARVKARLVHWAQTVEINTNILPLDLISYFNLSQSLLSSFLILYLPILHHGLVHMSIPRRHGQ